MPCGIKGCKQSFNHEGIMSKYQEAVTQLCFVVPTGMANQVRAKAREISISAEMDIEYSDVVVAAIYKTIGGNLPSEQSLAAFEVMMMGDENV